MTGADKHFNMIKQQTHFTHAEHLRTHLHINTQQSLVCIYIHSHLYTVHAAGPFYTCTCSTSLFTHVYTCASSRPHLNIYNQNAQYACICTTNRLSLHMYQQQALFIRTRLLVVFTLHIGRSLITSTQTSWSFEYPHPHAAVPFTQCDMHTQICLQMHKLTCLYMPSRHEQVDSRVIQR